MKIYEIPVLAQINSRIDLQLFLSRLASRKIAEKLVHGHQRHLGVKIWRNFLKNLEIALKFQP